MGEVRPLVSVVMGVYNGERFLRQSIESILCQTLKDFEFIIVNDGSTDATAEILISFIDPRIRIITNDCNIGLAKSLNLGISFAKGNYIARQDADDLSYPERLKIQTSYLDEHPLTGVVGTSTQWIDERETALRIWPVDADNDDIQENLMSFCPLIHGSTMYRRQCFEEVGGYDDSMRTGQDYDFWLRVSETWDLVSLSNVLYMYRRHPDMASIQHNIQQSQNAKFALDRAIHRRLGFMSLALGVRPRHVSYPRLYTMKRYQLAQRYLSWSAGTRMINRNAATRFLVAALLFDPLHRATWKYIGGIFLRKVSLRLGPGEEPLAAHKQDAP